MDGTTGFSTKLDTRLIKAPKPHRVRSIRTPFGRIGWTRDKGTGAFLATQPLASHLQAIHRDPQGRVLNIVDCGSGNVQTNFVVGLANDTLANTTNYAAQIFRPSVISTPARAYYMYSGTGTTVNTYDFQLGTTAGPASGSITPTIAVSANNSTLTYVGTITYASTLTIGEWGLFNINSQGAISTATTNTFTATSIATATWNNAPAAANSGWAGYVAVAGTVGGYIIQNTTATTASAVNISPGWYNLTSGGGTATTPSSNTSISVYPLMYDHKLVSPTIGVNNGDSIQFTYTLTITAGG